MVIEIKKYSPTNHLIKALIYWAPKVWKTTLGATSPKPLFVCAESWLLSVADKAPDFVEVKTLKELKELYKFLRDDKPDYESIVIDSLSEISKIIKDDITDHGKNPMRIQDWWVYGEEMMQTVRQIVALPYHIICIVHSKEIAGENGWIEKYDLAIEGKAKDELPRYFDTIGYMYIDKEWKNQIMVSWSSKTISGDRSNIIPKVNTPLDIQEWINAIKSIKTGKQKVVKEISAAEENKADVYESIINESWITEDLRDKADKTRSILQTTGKKELAAKIGAIKLQIQWAELLSEEQKKIYLKFVDLASSKVNG